MLRDVTADGGMGFCHGAIPALLPWGYHGPFVVALDSSVLVDLQQHGYRLLNDEVPAGIDEPYAGELSGLADLLNLWLLRDLRFIVTPRSLTDAKRVTTRFLDGRSPAVEALAKSLAFQLGDWNFEAPSGRPLRFLGDETGLPDGADRDLVLQAQAVGARVFLTRDHRVLERVSLTGPPMVVTSPRRLAAELANAGVQPFSGGTCDVGSCPYRDWPGLAPDMGKWGGLLAILGGEE